MDAIRKEQAKLMTAAAAASKGQSKKSAAQKQQQSTTGTLSTATAATTTSSVDDVSSHYSIVIAGDTNIDNQAELGADAAMSGVELLLLQGTVPANFVEHG